MRIQELFVVFADMGHRRLVITVAVQRDRGLWERDCCFSVFGTPDDTLALVFDILHEML